MAAGVFYVLSLINIAICIIFAYYRKNVSLWGPKVVFILCVLWEHLSAESPCLGRNFLGFYI